MFTNYVRYSPIGEYLRMCIIERLAKGPATVVELDKLAKECIDRLGVRYDWKVWPELLRREVFIINGVATLSDYGKVLYREAYAEIMQYLNKVLGLEKT
ncbi:MAG: hypothetical protein QXT27_01645 [Pyrobaculum sp.]